MYTNRPYNRKATIYLQYMVSAQTGGRGGSSDHSLPHSNSQAFVIPSIYSPAYGRDIYVPDHLWGQINMQLLTLSTILQQKNRKKSQSNWKYNLKYIKWLGHKNVCLHILFVSLFVCTLSGFSIGISFHQAPSPLALSNGHNFLTYEVMYNSQLKFCLPFNETFTKHCFCMR